MALVAEKIGFIGVGAMSEGMIRRLANSGYDVKANDIRPDQIEKLAALNCTYSPSPADAAEGVALLVISVFSAAQAELVLFGQPPPAYVGEKRETDADISSRDACAISTLKKGATVICHTTVSPDAARALEKRLLSTGHHFLDAPVIGGKGGSDTGTLTILASGTAEAMDCSVDFLRQVGERFYKCGDCAGAASAVKMIDNMLTGIHTVAAAEAVAFATKFGASPSLVHDAVSRGMGNSMVFQKWLPLMMEDEFHTMGSSGMAAMKKDLSICLEQAQNFNFPLPMTAVALQQFLGGSACSETRNDACAVVKLYEKLGATDVSAAARGKNQMKLYRVVSVATMRESFELDSPKLCTLEPGTIIKATQMRVNEAGQTRVQCAKGWTSVKSRTDGTVLVPYVEKPRSVRSSTNLKGSVSSTSISRPDKIPGLEHY